MHLSENQLRVVTTDADKAIVVACPGSGKTEVIVQRVIHLIKKGCPSTDIAIITYTNAAARVAEERVMAALGYARESIGLAGVKLGFIGTLHSFCLAHMSRFGFWKQAIRVIDDDEADERLAEVQRSLGVKAGWHLLSACRRDWLHEMDEPETPVRIAVRRYYFNMMATGEFDHNSILVMAYRMLTDPTMPRRAWAHLIVDEFQDAASIDAGIYYAASAENRFYVGDPMQSIFAFRGARAGIMSALASDAPGWTRFELAENWRSLPEVCKALTNLSRNAPSSAIKALQSFANSGGVVQAARFQNDAAEAVSVASAVAGKVRENPDVAGEIAVLARTNAIADRLAEALGNEGVSVRRLVPVEVPGDWKFALSALEYLAAPTKRTMAAMFRRANERNWFAARTDFEGLTGDADKLESELRALTVSEESIAMIKKRFDELPVSADLWDLSVDLALQPMGRVLQGEGVYVGTIHSAKGAEFDTVLLVGFEDEVIPGHSKKTDVEEERRVAFVGMSRAKRQLIVSWAERRAAPFGHGHHVEHAPSRFIAEAGL